jgi:hypothetical protein
VWHHEDYHQEYPQYAANQLAYQTGDQAGQSAGTYPAGDARSVHTGDEAKRQRYQEDQATQK